MIKSTSPALSRLSKLSPLKASVRSAPEPTLPDVVDVQSGSPRTARVAVAPIALAASCVPAETDWAGDCWDFVVTGSDLEDDDYYGNTLKALCLVVRAGLWRQL